MNIENQLKSAVQLHQSGDFINAQTAYQKVLDLDPQNIDALHLLGVIAQQQGKPQESLTKIRAAIQLNSKIPLFHSNLGNAYRDLGQFEEARAAYETALKMDANFIDAMINLASLCIQAENFKEAFRWADQALKIKPHAHALCFRGTARKHLGEIDAARADLQEAVRLNPQLAQAWTNLGNVLRDLLLYDEALAAHERAVAIAPNLADAWNNRGYVLKQLGRPGDALESYERALILKPDFYSAQFNKSMILLHRGDFKNGFECYEFRRKLKNAFQFSLPIPEWRGEDLGQKQILIYGEQGLGDTFQFIRFIDELLRMRAAVSLACLPHLHQLLAPWAKNRVRLVGFEIDPQIYHFQASLMSLPHKLQIGRDQIKAVDAYLTIDEGIRSYWKNKISGVNGKKVGLCWQGNPKFPEDQLRSIPLKILEPLLEIEGIEFFSLQKGFGSEQIQNSKFKNRIHDHTQDFDLSGHQFLDVSGLIANLDSVISIDSAIAHLTGALGTPVNILLPKVSDWRWGYEGDDRPWYSSATLIRQTKSRDWNSALPALKKKMGI